MQCNIAKAHSCRKSRGRSNKLQFVFFHSLYHIPNVQHWINLFCVVLKHNSNAICQPHMHNSSDFFAQMDSNTHLCILCDSILLDSFFSLFLSLSDLFVVCCAFELVFVSLLLCCAVPYKCEPMCVEHIVHVHCDLYRSTGAAAGLPNNRRSVCIRSPISLFSLIYTCKHK